MASTVGDELGHLAGSAAFESKDTLAVESWLRARGGWHGDLKSNGSIRESSNGRARKTQRVDGTHRITRLTSSALVAPYFEEFRAQASFSAMEGISSLRRSNGRGGTVARAWNK